MEFVGMVDTNGQVAPFTGAWIEIAWMGYRSTSRNASHPSRVRGLKFFQLVVDVVIDARRTLHGCVD